jgi:cell division protein ZapA
LKKRFNIKVMGQQFTVLSDRGDKYVEDVVKYVNDRAKEIGDASKDVSASGVAVLVALNIVDELFKIKEENKDFVTRLERRSERLINYIEERS